MGWLAVCVLAAGLSVVLLINKLVYGKQDFRLFGTIMHVVLWSILIIEAALKQRTQK